MDAQLENAFRGELGNCPHCGHDMPGVSGGYFSGWTAFCTECRYSVTGTREDIRRIWGVKVESAIDRAERVVNEYLARKPELVAHDPVYHPPHYNAKYITQLPAWSGKCVAMTVFHDRIYVACEHAVFILIDNILCPLKFEAASGPA